MPTMISVVATGNRMKGAEMPPFIAGPRTDLLASRQHGPSSAPGLRLAAGRVRLLGLRRLGRSHVAPVLNLVLPGGDHPLAGLQVAAQDLGPARIRPARLQGA